MKSNLSELYRLTEDKIKPASKILSRAFYDNPVFEYLIPDSSERKSKLKYVFEYIMRYDILYGEVYAISSNLEGIAGWLPTETAFQTVKRQIKSGGPKVILKLGKDFYKRLQHSDQFTNGLHKKYMPSEHWYLYPLGVDPDFQGNGYASTLLKAMFTRIDQEGLPIYLETNTDKNVAIYKHFGFKILEDTTIPDTDVRVCAMLREPST